MSHTLILRFARYNRRKVYNEYLYPAPRFAFENLPTDNEPQMKESKPQAKAFEIIIKFLAILLCLMALSIINSL